MSRLIFTKPDAVRSLILIVILTLTARQMEKEKIWEKIRQAEYVLPVCRDSNHVLLTVP